MLLYVHIYAYIYAIYAAAGLDTAALEVERKTDDRNNEITDSEGDEILFVSDSEEASDFEVCTCIHVYTILEKSSVAPQVLLICIANYLHT